MASASNNLRLTNFCLLTERTDGISRFIAVHDRHLAIHEYQRVVDLLLVIRHDEVYCLFTILCLIDDFCYSLCICYLPDDYFETKNIKWFVINNHNTLLFVSLSLFFNASKSL